MIANMAARAISGRRLVPVYSGVTPGESAENQTFLQEKSVEISRTEISRVNSPRSDNRKI